MILELFALASIIDSSWNPRTDRKLLVKAFCLKEEQIPKFEVGKIIILDKLMLGDPRNPNCSSALYNEMSHSKVIDYDFSSKKIVEIPYPNKPNPELINIIHSLAQFIVNSGGEFDEQKITLLCQVQPNSYFNCMAFVIGICEIENENSTVLRICDGTFLSRSMLISSCRNFDYITAEKYVTKLMSITYDVFIYDEHRLSAKDISPGEYVLLTNLHIANYRPSGRHDHEFSAGSLCSYPDYCLKLYSGSNYGRSLAKVYENYESINERIMALVNSSTPEEMNAFVHIEQCKEFSEELDTDLLDYSDHLDIIEAEKFLSCELPAEAIIEAKIIDYHPHGILNAFHYACVVCEKILDSQDLTCNVCDSKIQVIPFLCFSAELRTSAKVRLILTGTNFSLFFGCENDVWEKNQIPEESILENIVQKCDKLVKSGRLLKFGTISYNSNGRITHITNTRLTVNKL
ncbi:MAG: 3-ketoacyl-CoA thiolase with broad chain length specificity [Paramarteilia canceri]